MTDTQAVGRESEDVTPPLPTETQSDTSLPLQGISVVITAGPTREPLDPVRFLSNRSSGKMGYALAVAAQQLGATVTLISGPVALSPPDRILVWSVETALEMYECVQAQQDHCQIFIGCAAVSDYRVVAPQPRKIKKSEGATDELTLQLVKNPDIIAQVAQWPRRPFTVGFAAETHDLAVYAQEKRRVKQLDLIAANWVGAQRGFEVNDNQLQVYAADEEWSLGPAPKSVLAMALMALIAQRYLRLTGSDA